MISNYIFFQYYLEPPQRLQDELRKNGLSEMQFFLLKHGESRLIEIKEADEKKDDDDEEQAEEQAAGDGQEADQGLIDYLVDKVTGDDD